MPWLYAVAALTNVAGSLIGYAAGTLAWQARRESRRSKGAPHIAVGPGSVNLVWDIK